MGSPWRLRVGTRDGPGAGGISEVAVDPGPLPHGRGSVRVPQPSAALEAGAPLRVGGFVRGAWALQAFFSFLALIGRPGCARIRVILQGG